MKSKFFYLTTSVIVIAFIIGCAGANSSIELYKSEIKYSKPLSATHMIEGKKVKYHFWFNNNKWKLLDHENPLFKTVETKAKEKNANVYYVLLHNSNEIAAAIEESRLNSSNENFYKYYSKSIKGGGGAIIDKEIRLVNGSNALYVKSTTTTDSIKYIILNYFLSTESGAINVIASTSESLFIEHKSDMLDLLNGLVDPNSKITPVKSNDDIESKLLKLKNLRDTGLITQEEYNKKKAELLENF